jgi:hypothetical protein
MSVPYLRAVWLVGGTTIGGQQGADLLDPGRRDDQVGVTTPLPTAVRTRRIRRVVRSTGTVMAVSMILALLPYTWE